MISDGDLVVACFKIDGVSVDVIDFCGVQTVCMELIKHQSALFVVF